MNEGHSTAGRSIIEMLWEQADIKYATFRDMFAEAEANNTEPTKEFYNTQGQLQGLSYALGRMLYTYDKPKDAMDKIKKELRERWENEEEEDDDAE